MFRVHTTDCGHVDVPAENANQARDQVGKTLSKGVFIKKVKVLHEQD